MDNASFGMFGECDDYAARLEYIRDMMNDGDECQNEDECDYIPGLDDGEWMDDDDFAADYYGEEEFA